MKKFHIIVSIFILLSFISSLCAKSFEYKTKIVSINGNQATTGDTYAVPLGASGVVIHSFDKDHSTIVAKAIKNAKNSIIFKKFDDLEQDVLPVPKLLPQVGDIVILNYLYNYAMAITPNYKTYKEVISRHKNISWLHPDLFAAKLFAKNNPSPDRETFQKMCKDYSFSLLYFAINNRGYFVDCNSFRVLKTEDIDTYQKRELPFYTRVKNITASWFSFGKSKISNYDNYYKMLIKE